MFISKPLLNTRLFTAAIASLPANNTVEVEVNSAVSCSPVNSLTIRGGTKYRANNYAYPYRYQFIGTNSLGLTINQLTGLISGTIPRINTKTFTSDALKVEVVDFHKFRANFADRIDNFKKNRYCEIIFKVLWPAINVPIPSNKLTFTQNMDDTVSFNPFIDANNIPVTTGGAMAGGVYADAGFKYEFDVTKLKDVYASVPFFNDISATSFGDLTIDNNTGLITGTLNDKFLSFFPNHLPETKNIALYFIVKDKFDNRYGVDKNGNINSRININLALTLTELTVSAPAASANLFLLRSSFNTLNTLPTKVINGVTKGVKPYTYTFASTTFTNDNFTLTEQADKSVNLNRSSASPNTILTPNSGTTAVININDKSGQTKTVTAFIEVRDDIALLAAGNNQNIDIAVGDGLTSIYDDSNKTYYNKFAKNPFYGATGGYTVYTYSASGNVTTIDSSTGNVNNQQFSSVGTFTNTYNLTDAKGYIKSLTHTYKVWPKLVAVVDSTLPTINAYKTKEYFAETNLSFYPISITTAGSGNYKYEITASSGTYASSYSINATTGEMTTFTVVNDDTSVANFTIRITDTTTHVEISGLQVQIKTKPAKVTINPASFSYPLNEVNGFAPFADLSTSGTTTSKLSGVPTYKYTFVDSGTDTATGVTTKDYYTIDANGKITYTGNGLPFDPVKSTIYVKVADASSPTIVKPAIATINLFGLTISYPGAAPQIGSSLTVSGLPSGISGATYQWYTIENGVPTILSGSTNSSFSPTSNESHKSIAVVVNYVSNGIKYAVSSLNAVTVLAANETPVTIPYPVFAFKWQKAGLADFAVCDMDGYFAIYGATASNPNPTITNADRIGGGGYNTTGGSDYGYVTNISGHSSANSSADLTAAGYSGRTGSIDVQRTNIYEAYRFELKTILTDPRYKNIKYFAFVVHDLASVLRTPGSQLTYKIYDFDSPTTLIDSTMAQAAGSGSITSANMVADGSAATAAVLGYYTRYESVWVYTPKMVYLSNAGDGASNISALHLG